MVVQDQARLIKIGSVIGSKKEAPTPPCLGGKLREKLSLKNSVFMVTQLRPWVRKKNENVSNEYFGRNRLEKQSSFRAYKVEVVEFASVSFPSRTFNAIAGDIYSDANLLGMSGCIRREKMAVTTTDFPGE